MTLPADQGVRERAMELLDLLQEASAEGRMERMGMFLRDQLVPFLNYELIPFMRTSRALFNRRMGFVKHVDEDYTMEVGDQFVLADSDAGAVEVTLPPVADHDALLHVKRIGSNTVTIVPPSGATIDGGLSASLTVANQSVCAIPDNSDPDDPRYWLVGTYP